MESPGVPSLATLEPTDDLDGLESVRILDHFLCQNGLLGELTICGQLRSLKLRAARTTKQESCLGHPHQLVFSKSPIGKAGRVILVDWMVNVRG